MEPIFEQCWTYQIFPKDYISAVLRGIELILKKGPKSPQKGQKGLPALCRLEGEHRAPLTSSQYIYAELKFWASTYLTPVKSKQILWAPMSRYKAFGSTCEDVSFLLFCYLNVSYSFLVIARNIFSSNSIFLKHFQ